MEYEFVDLDEDFTRQIESDMEAWGVSSTFDFLEDPKGLRVEMDYDDKAVVKYIDNEILTLMGAITANQEIDCERTFMTDVVVNGPFYHRMDYLPAGERFGVGRGLTNSLVEYTARGSGGSTYLNESESHRVAGIMPQLANYHWTDDGETITLVNCGNRESVMEYEGGRVLF